MIDIFEGVSLVCAAVQHVANFFIHLCWEKLLSVSVINHFCTLKGMNPSD